MLKITECFYHGRYDDDDYGFNINTEVHNATEHEFKKIRYSVLLKNKEGVAINGCNSEGTDLYVEQGDSVDFVPSRNWQTEHWKFIPSEDLKIEIYATALHMASASLGEVALPQNAGAVLIKEISVHGDLLQTLGATVIRMEPDDDGDIRIEVSCGIANQTDRYVDEVIFMARLVDRRGEIIDEFGDSQRLPPNGRQLFNTTNYSKKGKLKDAKIQIWVEYYLPACSGYAEAHVEKK